MNAEPMDRKNLIEWVLHALETKSQTIQQAARARAALNLPDQEACELLASDLALFQPHVVDREISGWFPREQYLDDRAYRLLVGVRTGEVPQMPDERREQFSGDEQFGRVRLSEAFARIAEVDPQIGAAVRSIQQGDQVDGNRLGVLLARHERGSPLANGAVRRVVFTMADHRAAGIHDDRPILSSSQTLHQAIGLR